MVGVQAYWPCLQLSGEDDDEVEGAHTEESPFFPSVHVRVMVGGWLEEEGKLLTFNTPELGVWKTAGKKVLYMVSTMVKHLRALEGLRAGAWQQEGFTPAKKNWRLLYKSPLPKRSGDRQWRIIHGFIATNRHLAHIDQAQDVGCPFCRVEESVAHLFIKYSHLKGLFLLLKELCERFGVSFDMRVFVLDTGYTVKNKLMWSLINFLLGQAKIAVWLMRRKKVQEGLVIEPEVLFCGMVSERLRVEYVYYNLMCNLDIFKTIWCIEDAICKINNEGNCELIF